MTEGQQRVVMQSVTAHQVNDLSPQISAPSARRGAGATFPARAGETHGGADVCDVGCRGGRLTAAKTRRVRTTAVSATRGRYGSPHCRANRPLLWSAVSQCLRSAPARACRRGCRGCRSDCGKSASSPAQPPPNATRPRASGALAARAFRGGFFLPFARSLHGYHRISHASPSSSKQGPATGFSFPRPRRW